MFSERVLLAVAALVAVAAASSASCADLNLTIGSPCPLATAACGIGECDAEGSCAELTPPCFRHPSDVKTVVTVLEVFVALPVYAALLTLVGYLAKRAMER